jgi:hypothetical protein
VACSVWPRHAASALASATGAVMTKSRREGIGEREEWRGERGQYAAQLASASDEPLARRCGV